MDSLRSVSDAELLRLHATTHERFQKVTKAIDKYTYVDEREGGSHSHRLVRDEGRTTESGGHSHLFILPDGRFVYTEDDGFHAHEVPDSIGNETSVDGKHSHKIYLDGQEYVTDEASAAHSHELMRQMTLWNGIHTHTLRIGGDTLTSMTPGRVWEEMGRPSQSKNPSALIVTSKSGSTSVEAAEPTEVVDAHRAVITEMARRGMDHDTPLQLEGENNVEGAEDEERASIFVEFQKKDDDQRIVTGVVLVPETVDAQKDIYSADVIKKAQRQFTAGINRSTKLGYMHNDFSKRFELVESYIAPSDLTINRKKVKKGSWVMSVKVLDDDVWNAVKEKKIRGFSIQGIAKVVRLGEKAKAKKNAAPVQEEES